VTQRETKSYKEKHTHTKVFILNLLETNFLFCKKVIKENDESTDNTKVKKVKR